MQRDVLERFDKLGSDAYTTRGQEASEKEWGYAVMIRRDSG